MITKNNSRRPRTLAAFTLLEMIVVIAIIGVLSSIIVPSTVSSIRDSKIEAANTMAYEYYSAVQNYLTDLQIKDVPLCGTDTMRRALPADSAVVYNSQNKIIFGAVDKAEMNMNPGTKVAKVTSLSAGTEDDKKKIRSFVDGVYKYLDSTQNNNPGYWVAQFDVDTYTVDWVVYCNQENAQQSLNTLLNNYSGERLYQVVFGKSDGRNWSQEYDTMHNGSEKTPSYVGQYPVPYNVSGK